MMWNFNYSDPITKNRINMGLGTYPELSLANARKKVVRLVSYLHKALIPRCNAMHRTKPNERRWNIRSRTWPPAELCRLTSAKGFVCRRPLRHGQSA